MGPAEHCKSARDFVVGADFSRRITCAQTEAGSYPPHKSLRLPRVAREQVLQPELHCGHMGRPGKCREGEQVLPSDWSRDLALLQPVPKLDLRRSLQMENRAGLCILGPDARSWSTQTQAVKAQSG
ncbi:hypothetical protein H8959_007294 [Pygathrix nigripes]